MTTSRRFAPPMRTKLAALIVLSLLCADSGAEPIAQEPLNAFIGHMADTHGFDAAELHQLFTKVERADRILELMSRPAEKVKPWWEYRELFISDKRIADGVDFLHANSDALARAEREYGVPPAVIAAIIGVETSYGRIIGSHPVVAALATLAFHYPDGRQSRMDFFRAQLEHFLLMAREEGADPLGFKGSYAGAMGMPQFMPENYRKLAVDFDGDGKRDIWSDADDAIGSVGNYLNHHGWVAGGPITIQAVVRGEQAEQFAQTSIKPESRLADLTAAGIQPATPLANGEEAAALYALAARNGTEYWIGYTNFYVISRYNPRIKYAMAVSHLAAAIEERARESE